jgi:hypothetical protein
MFGLCELAGGESPSPVDFVSSWDKSDTTDEIAARQQADIRNELDATRPLAV